MSYSMITSFTYCCFLKMHLHLCSSVLMARNVSKWLKMFTLPRFSPVRLLLFYFCKWKLQLEYCLTAKLTPALSLLMWHPRFLSGARVGIIKHSHIEQSVVDEQQCVEVHPTLRASPTWSSKSDSFKRLIGACRKMIAYQIRYSPNNVWWKYSWKIQFSFKEKQTHPPKKAANFEWKCSRIQKAAHKNIETKRGRTHLNINMYSRINSKKKISSSASRHMCTFYIRFFSSFN